MRKMFVILSVLVIVLSTACGGHKTKTTSATSYVKIIKKGVDKDQSYWVSVVDPNNNSDKQEFRMNIDNMNTWNLLETGKEYISDYEYTDKQKGVKLITIKIPS